MSIFKETFRPFVFKQLRIREAIVKKGNNLDGRFGKPRIDLETEAGKTEKVDIPAGSFFTNTVVKQCTIRMCSGVDLREDNNITEHSKYENPKDLVNEGLAIRYILEGGIAAKQWDFKNNRNLTAGSEVKYSQPRGKLSLNRGNIGKHYGASYGDPYIRSDGDGDFGMVPMPGILDAEIRTKSAYGSLREAKVNFVCHNRRQLEIMELLYMRPGYPILLEWGWTPHINNDNPPKKEEFPPYLTEFFKQESKINDIQLKILKNKKSSGGNYDGFVGYCKNFDIKSRADGGYDCTTEVIAMGEILEGLKGKRQGKYKSLPGGVEYEVDNLEHYLSYLIYTLGGEGGNMQLEKIGEAGGINIVDNQKSESTIGFLGDLIKLMKPDVELTEFTDKEKAFIDSRDILGGNSREMFNKNSQYYEDIIDRDVHLALIAKSNIARDNIKSLLEPFVILRGDEIKLYGYGNVPGTKITRAYVRWDLLTEILNKYVFPHTSTSDKGDPVIEITNHKDVLDIDPPLLDYTLNSLPSHMQQRSVKFVSEGGWFEDDTNVSGQVGEITDISINPDVCLLPHQLTLTSQNNARKISLIHFNMEYLLKSYKELRYTEDGVLKDDFSLFDWLKKIWDGVNTACVGTHNFILQTELERPNVLRIIDMNYQSNLKPEDLFEIKIQSNESIVRDFNFNTTIPSAMGATIAVAAQAPQDIETLDAVTFAAFT